MSGLLENIEIKIITPSNNYRVTDEGNSTHVPVTIYYKGTYDRKTALITVNGMGPVPCDLISGQEVNCGSAPLTALGGQNIKVQVNKANGVDSVTTEVNFRWEPYQGLEKFAYNFSGYVGDKSAPMGFFYLTILAILIVGAVVVIFGIKNKFTIELPSYGRAFAVGSNGEEIGGNANTGLYIGPINGKKSIISGLFDATENAAKTMFEREQGFQFQIGAGGNQKRIAVNDEDVIEAE